MSNAKKRYHLAFNYAQTGQLAEAEICLRGLISRYPEHPDVLHLLGIVLKNLDRVDEAERLLSKAVAKCPHNARYHYHYGLALVKSGRPDKAAGAFAEAIRIEPNLCNARYNFAKALKDAGDLESAIRAYQDLLAAEPDHVEALYNLANIFCDQERFDEASQLYVSALNLKPDHANARTNLAFIQDKQGRPSDAAENVQIVLENNPAHSDAGHLSRRMNSRLIPGWHFAMLNDRERNDAYNQAISRAAANAKHVLEIGTGSGLLAMMAARAGAPKVTTCETVTPLAQTASRIIRRNGYANRIHVINKKSTQLKLGTDLAEPADVLIAEVFDVGLLGEHFWPAILHAKQNLLAENATIIPQAAKIYAVLIECPELRSVNPIKEIAGFDLSDFDVFRPPGYVQINLDDINYREISDTFEICHLDFRQEVFVPPSHALTVTPTISGTCHGIAFWYDLYLDPQTMISTRSGRKSNHWKQALQFFDTDHRVETGQPIRLTVHASQTGLSFDID
jgi:tetratricopeptide (TPR) repeat protein